MSAVIDIVATFGWRDAVDVLLVTLIVYRVFVMFRGTRAVPMIVGLGVLVIGTAFAGRLQLRTLGWLFDNVWSFWVIALVVLFQPEIRQALTRMGHGPIVRRLVGVSREERAHVADEVSTAAEALAARGTGALIILERATGLRQYAELGTMLDAAVTADLLVALFQPTSPLHDGAVLIQGSRIVAAGCFLPLSRNLNIGRTLGTRHRAALGITEEADAVAVIVSEETQQVSVAVEGQLERLPEPGLARPRLAVLLGTAERAARASFARGFRRARSSAANRA
jgi:diadenylate cyclase